MCKSGTITNKSNMHIEFHQEIIKKEKENDIYAHKIVITNKKV